jgi:hypothetical protein
MSSVFCELHFCSKSYLRLEVPPSLSTSTLSIEEGLEKTVHTAHRI